MDLEHARLFLFDAKSFPPRNVLQEWGFDGDVEVIAVAQENEGHGQDCVACHGVLATAFLINHLDHTSRLLVCLQTPCRRSISWSEFQSRNKLDIKELLADSHLKHNYRGMPMARIPM